MRVKVSLALLFMFAFVFAAALVTSDVSAGEPCLRSQCVCELYCSTYAGPACKFFPTRPYYLYQINCEILPGETCQSCEEFNWDRVGCCRFGF